MPLLSSGPYTHEFRASSRCVPDSADRHQEKKREIPRLKPGSKSFRTFKEFYIGIGLDFSPSFQPYLSLSTTQSKTISLLLCQRERGEKGESSFSRLRVKPIVPTLFGFLF